MPAYYNEIDPYAADWLENLIAAGHIAPGVVDRRSIEDVRPDDLRDFEQCHFFAGLGGWSRALRLAGMPDTGRVWTGSCPCQPFSAAGKRGGTADERHLWPSLFHLIEQCRPSAFLGEQVASRDGLDWLDLVLSDLEGAGYDVGAADMCAASVGAPHRRQRLWFVADANEQRHDGGGPRSAGRDELADGGGAGLLGIAPGIGCSRLGGEPAYGKPMPTNSSACPHALADAGGERFDGEYARLRWSSALGRDEADNLEAARRGEAGHNGGPAFSFWSECDWIACRDGKARPVEPGTFPLAHGIPGRVGRLRAYGNAIVPQAAATFIQAAIPFRLGVFA